MEVVLTVTQNRLKVCSKICFCQQGPSSNEAGSVRWGQRTKVTKANGFDLDVLTICP